MWHVRGMLFAFWQACHGGERRMAEYLLALGADLNAPHRGVMTVLGVLLPRAPVDALTEQVGVPVVARVLLDHVHEQLAQ